MLIKEAAKARGVHPLTVRRMIKRGEIRATIRFIRQHNIVAYDIPESELPKIFAKPGGRPKKPV